MPETLGTRLDELAAYADHNAHLNPAQQLRGHATRQTTRRRAGAALLGAGALAITLNLAVTTTTDAPRPRPRPHRQDGGLLLE